MFRIYNGDIFLKTVRERRVLWLAGEYGSGKSLVEVMLSYLFLRERIVRAVVSTMPIAWAIPAACAPLTDVMVIYDEMGAEFDARSFGVKKQNDFRRRLIAFPRKLNMYVVLASKVAPDVSFRALTLQHTWGPLLGFDLFWWSCEEGAVGGEGWFWVSGLDGLYKEARHDPYMLTYHHHYIPSSGGYVDSLVRRAIAVAQFEEENTDPNDWGAGNDVQMGKVYTTAGRVLADGRTNLEIPAAGGSGGAELSGGGGAASEVSEWPLFVGVGSEKVAGGGWHYSG